MRICVYGASSSTLDARYLEGGTALGRALGQAGHSLVFGGGDSGLMGAVARGVKERGGTVVGVAPSFFQVDGVLFPDCDQLILTQTMRERKQKMEELADAFVMTPGGIGTFEEFFEILTLRQLGRHDKPIAILNTAGYFNDLCALLQKAADERFLTHACLALYQVFEQPQALLSYLCAAGPRAGAVRDYKEIREEAK